MTISNSQKVLEFVDKFQLNVPFPFFHKILNKSFAPWCPACNRFESTWNEFSLRSKDLNIRVGAADVNANPVLSGLFSVTSLPTIYQYKQNF